MTRGFIFTAKRQALLVELRRQGLSLPETARALGCDVEQLRGFLRTDAAPIAPPRTRAAQPAPRVPRPVQVARPGLIDIRHAPSSMEMMAAKWAAKARGA